MNESDLQAAYEAALDLLIERHGEESLGDYLEFGVYVGTSLLCMQRALESRSIEHVRLIGFDSFEGLPASVADEDDGEWTPGDYASDLETTRRNLTANGIDWSRVVLVPGWYDQILKPATRKELKLKRASLIMVDCDAYSSARAALEFCEPLIDDAVIFFDDWDANDLAARGLGEKRAFEEFLAGGADYEVRRLPSYRAADGIPQSSAVFLVSRRAGGSPADE